MELRQLRYFIRIVELGSMSRAALELDMVQSALSQQISRLEGELGARLLKRNPRGVEPTEAGTAFFREAKLTLRHAEQAMRSAQQPRLTGSVSIGLPATTESMLGLPLISALRGRFPDVRLHMVGGMSGMLADMLNARALDMAILFDLRGRQSVFAGRNWTVRPLFEEELFLIRARRRQGPALPAEVRLGDLGGEPLILPTVGHGLRSVLDAAFTRAQVQPRIALDVDSQPMTMAALAAGLGAVIQPWAVMGSVKDAAQRFEWARIQDEDALRINLLCSLKEEDLSPAALAARAVMAECIRQLIGDGIWQGTRLIHHKN
ncbi:LysR substrate-binding domain-containing protein [Bordetella genomosp. 12]|uniref:LysR family transcriptional regulator n=1 Tax=Bordetella genomosp. 12 TaxID=463035 RepID=A0A261VUM6_9BORD|nr:LysR substrate-binding domain-containing protein [Bordetella genomosp. 12]OZI77808.1 LysR family transcriptional regulator [Bordetella genomosp. 12]